MIYYITRNGLSEIKPAWVAKALQDQGQTVSYMPYNDAGASRWADVARRMFVEAPIPNNAQTVEEIIADLNGGAA